MRSSTVLVVRDTVSYSAGTAMRFSLAGVTSFVTDTVSYCAGMTTSRVVAGSFTTVRVTVFGHPDLSGDFQVGTSGSIALPLVGEVPAAGSSPRELEVAIANVLSPDYLKNPKVAVEVLTYRPFYIIGEVKSPGSYSYVNGMRVINAVALAGGFTYRAREDELYITRAEDGEKIPATQATVVRPGDVIEVPQRFF